MGLIRIAFMLGLALVPTGAGAKPPPAALTHALQMAMDKAVAANPDVPGIQMTYYALGRGEEWSGAAGKVAIGGSESLTADRPFRIASVTKLFVAATILRLHEQRRLAVTDTIEAYLSPETAAQLRRAGNDPAAIRIDQLLTHSSGMADHTFAPLFLDKTLGATGHHWTRIEQLEVLATEMKPVGKPGEAFHYSDSGYVVLGEIIERKTGKPLAAAVRELLNFKALGLNSTWWEAVEPVPAGLKSRSHQYHGTQDVTDIDPSFDVYGGGGLVSTTGDLTHFLHALATGKVFARPETLALALAAPKIDLGERGMIHALVPFIMPLGKHLCWQHGGHWGTNAFYCPDIDVAIAYGTNQDASKLYRGLAEDLLPIIEAATRR